MSIWKSYIMLLQKIQFFNIPGSIIWSLFPVSLCIGSIWHMNAVVQTSFASADQVLSLAMMVAQCVLLMMIPQCIRYLQDCCNTDLTTTMLLHPRDEQLVRSLQAPPKLIWVIPLDCALLIALQLYESTGDFGAAMVLATAMMAVGIFYFPLFGVLFGCLTNTLAYECKVLTDNKVPIYDGAKHILTKYQELKRASQLSMFIVATTCTFLTILYAYYFVILVAYSCYKASFSIVYLIVNVLCTKLFALYFCVIAFDADDCHESLLAVSKCLR